MFEISLFEPIALIYDNQLSALVTIKNAYTGEKKVYTQKEYDEVYQFKYKKHGTGYVAYSLFEFINRLYKNRHDRLKKLNTSHYYRDNRISNDFLKTYVSGKDESLLMASYGRMTESELEMIILSGVSIAEKYWYLILNSMPTLSQNFIIKNYDKIASISFSNFRPIFKNKILL